MVVQGRPLMSGFYRKMPKGIHLHLSTGLPGTSQVGSVWLVHGGYPSTPSPLLALSHLTNPRAPLPVCYASENHVFKNKLLPNHICSQMALWTSTLPLLPGSLPFVSVITHFLACSLSHQLTTELANRGQY